MSNVVNITPYIYFPLNFLAFKIGRVNESTSVNLKGLYRNIDIHAYTMYYACITEQK